MRKIIVSVAIGLIVFILLVFNSKDSVEYIQTPTIVKVLKEFRYKDIDVKEILALDNLVYRYSVNEEEYLKLGERLSSVEALSLPDPTGENVIYIETLPNSYTSSLQNSSNILMSYVDKGYSAYYYYANSRYIDTVLSNNVSCVRFIIYKNKIIIFHDVEVKYVYPTTYINEITE